MTPTERPPTAADQGAADDQHPAAAPFDPTVRVESQRPSGSRSLGPVIIGLLLLGVTLISAGVGFVLSGGRLPDGEAARPPTATVTAQATPVQAAPQPPTQAPQPPTPPPSAATAVATLVPAPTAPPIAAVQPEPARASPPQPTAPKPTNPPAAKPASQPAGRDPRLAQVENTIQEYFSALNAQDYPRAHQVCCTDAWRSRYPLDRWERNFDGVTDLHLVGEPRYQRIEPDLIVVDTDYTFRSGGRQRDFTLRWTFQPVGDRWQAELAEAFAR